GGMRSAFLAWGLLAVVAGTVGGPASAAEPLPSLVEAFDVRGLDTAVVSAADLFELASVTTRDESGPARYSALHAAPFYDMADGAGALLDRGVNIEGRDDLGRTALMIAAAFGSDKVVALLLARGADQTARDAVRGDTALHYAALTGHKEAARLLLAA